MHQLCCKEIYQFTQKKTTYSELRHIDFQLKTAEHCNVIYIEKCCLSLKHRSTDDALKNRNSNFTHWETWSSGFLSVFSILLARDKTDTDTPGNRFYISLKIELASQQVNHLRKRTTYVCCWSNLGGQLQ